jgi:hypothetical protein
MKGLVPALLGALALASVADAANDVRNQGCGAGKLVLDIRYRVLNDVDTGVRGNDWAFDNYLRTVMVWRKTRGRYCAASTYSGTFTTIAGASPGGTTTIPAGIRGTLRGSSTTTFKGRASATNQPTRGDLGTKDFACTSDDKKGDCSGTYDWLSDYFTSADAFKSFKYIRYDFTYKASEGGRGTWRDELSGGRIRSHGDIVPKKTKKRVTPQGRGRFRADALRARVASSRARGGER